MREPLFTHGNKFLKDTIIIGDPASLKRAEDRAALHRAVTLSIESAFSFGIDMPVGAVALQAGNIVGRGFANNRRFSISSLHAEQMALLDARFDVMGGRPDTVVASLEPCSNCQDAFAQQKDIKRVIFGISRAEVADMGLVRPSQEDAYQRTTRLSYHYELASVEDEQLHAVGLTVMRHVSRNPESQVVEVDVAGLQDNLVTLNGV